MSYDCYVAICKPLHYTTIMSSKICMQLVLCCRFAGSFVIFPPLLLGLNLDFYAFNIVDHFYYTQLLETMGYISALVTLIVTLVMVIISYTYIVLRILKIRGSLVNQRKKASSTCSSHMIVISLSYGSCIFMYVKPSVKQRTSYSKGIAVLNTSVALLFNPFIYTLWNKQVKTAFMNMVHKIVSFSNK
ncbi:unnamed protein product [Nyctereutes procyonoides]|uniref:(raccoon dog) hypothetical protein n=1 Tax=Nyctereutes procyonoides TaxID=34880 RepID=A0A811Z6W2_NYCPR|nr:unnamed protein product [Nyctereutes procyonoides]